MFRIKGSQRVNYGKLEKIKFQYKNTFFTLKNHSISNEDAAARC